MQQRSPARSAPVRYDRKTDVGLDHGRPGRESQLRPILKEWIAQGVAFALSLPKK